MSQSTPAIVSSEEAVARRGMYGLLARLWLREVDRTFLQQLMDAPLRNAFTTAGGILPAGDDDTTIEQLAIDFCQLFVGPSGHHAPFQSVRQSGQFQNTATKSMSEYVEIVGFESGDLPVGVMLDHLGIQLVVMGRIVGEISISPEQGGDLDALSELARGFFSSHLRWPLQMLESACRQADTNFYRSVVAMTNEFLTSESRHLGMHRQ